MTGPVFASGWWLLVAASGVAPAAGSLSERQAVERAWAHLEISALAASAGGPARAVAGTRTFVGPTRVAWAREHTFGPGQGDEDALTIGQRFDLSGRAGLRAASDELRGRAAVEAAGGLAIDLEAEVRLAFHGARAATERVAVLESWQQRLEAAGELVEAAVLAGDEAAWARVHTHHELARAIVLVAGAAAERDAARAELAALVGLPPEAALPELEAPPMVRLEGATVGEFLQRLERHPVVVAGRTREQAGQSLQDAGDRAWIPQLDVAVGYKTAGDGAGRGHGYVAGVAVELPLGGDASGDAAVGVAAATQARAEVRTWRVHREAQVRRTFAETSRLGEVAARAAEHLEHGHEALLRAAADAYRGGELDLEGLIEAHADARDDRLAVIDLLERAWRARVELDRLSGGML